MTDTDAGRSEHYLGVIDVYDSLKNLSAICAVLSTGLMQTHKPNLEDQLGDVLGSLIFARQHWNLNEPEILDRAYARYFKMKERYNPPFNPHNPQA